MSVKQPFDCVRLKRQIQQRLTAELAGMTLEQRRERMKLMAFRDEGLAKLWARRESADSRLHRDRVMRGDGAP